MTFPDPIDKIDFSIITSNWSNIAFFDDLFLNMQGMNLGLSDSVITQYEYNLLAEYIEIEKTPIESAMLVSSFSQMWVFSAYELLRLWRERIYKTKKWYENGGIDIAISNLSDEDDLNMTKNIRRNQLETYRDDSSFRNRVVADWEKMEPVYRSIELYRMNLAKHASPGNNSVMPRAPGYGRINMHCGAMDYELIHSDGTFEYLNRREIADELRQVLKE